LHLGKQGTLEVKYYIYLHATGEWPFYLTFLPAISYKQAPQRPLLLEGTTYQCVWLLTTLHMILHYHLFQLLFLIEDILQSSVPDPIMQFKNLFSSLHTLCSLFVLFTVKDTPYIFVNCCTVKSM